MWILIYLAVSKGVKTLGQALKITIPIPFLLLAALAIRGATLPGAMEGLIFYLKPNFAALLDISLWTAAIAQAFFSLSLAGGIMIAYSSYEPKKSDINKSAFTITFADLLVALVAGFAVFGTLGYMAAQKGVTVASLAAEGPGLAFIAFTQALLTIHGAAILGIIFFFVLVNLGLSSAFSIVEAVITPITDMVGEEHEGKVGLILCIIGFLMSLIFVTGAGVYFVDLIDHFVTTYPLILVGLFECIAVGWVYKASRLRDYANKVSYWKIGRWWDISIKYIAPALIIFLLINSLIKDLTVPYGGFPQWALNIGWAIVICTVVLSLALAYLPRSLRKDADKVLEKVFK